MVNLYTARVDKTIEKVPTLFIALPAVHLGLFKV